MTFQLDGHALIAERGEPVAHALIANDKVVLARSPKLHRPRGPTCLRGACDGCLMRVSGVPNVMTCLVPAEDGLEVFTQNVLGSRTTDLLRAADWFFPSGIDHHHFLAGVPGASTVLQAIARRVAGLGQLPSARPCGMRGFRERVDVLVVGAGAAGIGAAHALSSLGHVVLVDDHAELGGSTLALGADVCTSLLERYRLDACSVRLRTTAAGVYETRDGFEVLCVSPDDVRLIEPRFLVLATGAYDRMLEAPGNDLPGIFSARAAAWLACRGISVGDRIGVLGEGPFTTALQSALRGKSDVVPIRAPVTAVVGSTRVGSVRQGNHMLRIDALVLADAPVDPAFELAEQAGADVLFSGNGRFEVSSRRADICVVGELAGQTFDAPGRIAADAADVATRAWRRFVERG